MHAGLKGPGDLFRGQDGAEGKPAADRFGHGDDIGPQSEVFEGEERAGSARSALHLIGDDQETVSIPQLGQGADELRAGRPDASLALDELEHHGGGGGSDRLA